MLHCSPLSRNTYMESESHVLTLQDNATVLSVGMSKCDVSNDDYYA